MQNIKFIGNVTPLLPFNAEVTKRIQTGFGREKDLMLLYLNLCIAECIEEPAYMQKGSPIKLEKELIADPSINGKSLKEYVKEILKKYFKKNAKTLSREKIFPELIDPQDDSWLVLLQEAQNLSSAIIKIKENYLEIISGYKFEEKFSVFNDICSFLINKVLFSGDIIGPAAKILIDASPNCHASILNISIAPK